MLTPAGCKQRVAKQPTPLMPKAKARTILLTLKIKKNGD